MEKQGMASLYELAKSMHSSALEQIEHLLWQAQLGQHPDSVKITAQECDELAQESSHEVQAQWLRCMTMCLEQPGVFYRVERPTETWVGCRYGVEPHEYFGMPSFLLREAVCL